MLFVLPVMCVVCVVHMVSCFVWVALFVCFASGMLVCSVDVYVSVYVYIRVGCVDCFGLVKYVLCVLLCWCCLKD